jgi:hypothetical protein
LSVEFIFFSQKYKYIKALSRIVLVYLEGMLPSGICPIAKPWGVSKKKNAHFSKCWTGGVLFFQNALFPFFFFSFP